MLAAVLELKSRARDQVGHCARHEHLTRVSECFDAFGNVNCDATNVIAANFDFAGVYADPNIESE